MGLEYFLEQANLNSLALKDTTDRNKIGELQNKIILAQNTAFTIDVLSKVLVAPYFDNYGKAIDITTTPSPNGGL